MGPTFHACNVATPRKLWSDISVELSWVEPTRKLTTWRSSLRFRAPPRMVGWLISSQWGWLAEQQGRPWRSGRELTTQKDAKVALYQSDVSQPAGSAQRVLFYEQSFQPRLNTLQWSRLETAEVGWLAETAGAHASDARVGCKQIRCTSCGAYEAVACLSVGRQKLLPYIAGEPEGSS